MGYMSMRARDTLQQEQTTNTLPPLYRQINREDRLVVREGVCVLGRAREHINTHTYTNQYHLHSFFPDGCLPVLTVLRVSHQERRSVSVSGMCART